MDAVEAGHLNITMCAEAEVTSRSRLRLGNGWGAGTALANVHHGCFDD